MITRMYVHGYKFASGWRTIQIKELRTEKHRRNNIIAVKV